MNDDEPYQAIFALAERATAAEDPTARISLLHEVLSKTPPIEVWPSNSSRDAFVGWIEFELGLAYRDCNDVPAPDTLDLAAQAFARSISILPFEEAPDTWVAVRLCLADVLLGRRVSTTTDLEKAVSLAGEALSVLSQHDDLADWRFAHRIRAYAGFELLRTIPGRDDLREAVIESYLAELSLTGQADTNWTGSNVRLAVMYLDRTRGDLKGNLELATKYCGQALAVLSPEKDPENWKDAHRLRAGACRRLLRIVHEREDIQESFIESGEAFLSLSASSDENWAPLKINLADAYLDRKSGVRDTNLDRAMMHCQDALAVLSPETDRDNWVSAKVNFALAAARKKDSSHSLMDAAIEAARAATRVFDSSDRSEVFAGAHAALARILTSRARVQTAADRDEAIASFDKALQVLTGERDPERRARLQADLGRTLVNRQSITGAGDIDRAIQALEAANDCLSPQDHRDDVIGIREALGIAYLSRNRTVDSQERAIEMFQSAISLVSENDDVESWGVLQIHLSSVLAERLLGDPQANDRLALEKAVMALAALEKSAYPRGIADAATNLAGILAKVHSPRGGNHAAVEKALALLEKSAAALTPADGDSWVKTHFMLSGLYLERETEQRSDDIEAALRHCDAALEVIDPQATPWHWIDVQTNRSAALYSRIAGNSKTNKELAISTCREVLDRLPAEADPRRHLIIARRLGLALADEHQFRDAYAAFTSALAAAELLLAEGREMRDTLNALYESRELWPLAAYCAYRIGEPWTALELLERGRARLLRNAYRVDRPAQHLRNDIRESRLQLQHSHGPERLLLLDRLRQLREQLSRELQDETQEVFAGRSGIRELLKDVTADGTTVIVLLVSSIGVLAFVARSRDSETEMKAIEFEKSVYSDLEALLARPLSRTSGAGFVVDAAAYGAQQMGEDQWSTVLQDVSDRAGQLLFDRIVQELETLGLESGAPVALLAARGVTLMPVAMMRAGRNGARFVDRFALRVAPSLVALAISNDRAGQVPSPKRLAALVDTKGDLPFARLEVSLIDRWFADAGEVNVIDNKAGKEAILAILRESSYWHFACHGSFDWYQPEKAGLQLSHGRILSVDDLFNEIAGQPRLVVLSACETGLQDISTVPYEAFGLLGAMLHAGAAAAIGTLWRVDDLGAALLSARFYESLIRRRLSPAAALREAQIWIRDSNRRTLVDYLTARETLPAKLAEPAKSFLSRNFQESELPYSDPIHWAGWVAMGT